MLTDAQKAIITATVPLLETGGEALTTHFYRILLAEHPEVRPLFNHASQANGEQPRALANSVLMYARHINRLEALGDLAAQIVNKHVALQVQPEHYPIVGSCLLRAIEDVLGAEVATEAVIDAWAAAYTQLADLLIGAEAAAYERNASAPGGWRGARLFRVVRKEVESDEITSFYLSPVDAQPLLDFEPGQYISLRLHAGTGGQEVRRSYSLSAAPNGGSYRISVKREPGGVASNHLHDDVHEGSTLDVFPPSGAFTLAHSERPLVLISGGVGITPTLAMLESALKTKRPIRFVHCARSHKVHAFRASIDALAKEHPQLERFYCYDEAPHPHAEAQPQAVGRLDAQTLAQWMPAAIRDVRDVDAYFLGPMPFMRQIKRSLRELGVPEHQMRYEFFGPASALE